MKLAGGRWSPAASSGDAGRQLPRHGSCRRLNNLDFLKNSEYRFMSSTPVRARFAPSVRAIAGDMEASRLARQFIAVGGLSVALVIFTEALAAFSLSSPATRDYLFQLTTVMTLLAVFIVGALVWRLFQKALWLVRDATE